jgi:tRNA threonylcarbamoyladenosine biosynthesis protein TsaE
MLIFEADSEKSQEAIGARLSEAATDECIIYLRGDLGAGKTTLVRGFLRGLGYRGAVKSPTYTLLEPYSISGRQVYHLDLYRLGHPEELEYLGIRDLLGQDAVLLVEWPERGTGALPPADLVVDIQYAPTGRRLEMESNTDAGLGLLHRLQSLP